MASAASTVLADDDVDDAGREAGLVEQLAHADHGRAGPAAAA